MEAAKSSKSRLARTFHKVINLKPSISTTNKTGSNGGGGIGICILTSQDKVKEDSSTGGFSDHHKSQSFRAKNGGGGGERAVLEALIAKLFANITSIKASYAELQMAQHPYNSDAIQEADQAIVEELKAISELKRKFMRKQLSDLSPQVTLMLAEIHEQQALMKTYEIAVKKQEAEVDARELEINSLRKKLEEAVLGNKSLEKKLNASGLLSNFDNFKLSGLNTTHFVQVLHYALRSIRSFVKVLVKEMECAKWDFDLAINFIEPDALFAKPNHKTYVFESYVSKTMFEGFNHPNFMLSPNEVIPTPTQTQSHSRSNFYFEQFKKFKSLNPKHFFTQNPSSMFARFTKSKYTQLVHAKMECSFFGNLNQRKVVNSGGCPDSPFFTTFLEMSKRVWALHCLAFSYDQEVSIFQAKRSSRFNEVFMESVTDDVLCNTNNVNVTTTTTSEESSSSPSLQPDPDLRVGFTVLPGFNIGKSVVQCQVYLSPVSTPVRSR